MAAYPDVIVLGGKGYVPMGLSHGVRVLKPVAKDALITYDDVTMDESCFARKLRLQQETVLSESLDRNE